jgi:hypothetical protein
VSDLSGFILSNSLKFLPIKPDNLSKAQLYLLMSVLIGERCAIVSKNM